MPQYLSCYLNTNSTILMLLLLFFMFCINWLKKTLVWVDKHNFYANVCEILCRCFMYMTINNFHLLTRVLFETSGYATEVVLLLKISNTVQTAILLVVACNQFILRREADKITGAAQLDVVSPVWNLLPDGCKTECGRSLNCTSTEEWSVINLHFSKEFSRAICLVDLVQFWWSAITSTVFF